MLATVIRLFREIRDKYPWSYRTSPSVEVELAALEIQGLVLRSQGWARLSTVGQREAVRRFGPLPHVDRATTHVRTKRRPAKRLIIVRLTRKHPYTVNELAVKAGITTRRVRQILADVGLERGLRYHSGQGWRAR